MVRHRHAAMLALAAGLSWFSGCGGCQNESPTTPAAPAPQGQAAPAQAPTKAAPAAPAPTNTLPADAFAPPPEDAEAALAEDCFVMMDAYPDYGPPPLEVKFTSEVECNSGAPKFKWDFGDGSPPSSEANPTHKYDKVGEFVATVVVTGPSGGTDSDELDIVVEKEDAED